MSNFDDLKQLQDQVFTDLAVMIQGFGSEDRVYWAALGACSMDTLNPMREETIGLGSRITNAATFARNVGRDYMLSQDDRDQIAIVVEATMNAFVESRLDI